MNQVSSLWADCSQDPSSYFISTGDRTYNYLSVSAYRCAARHNRL